MISGEAVRSQYKRAAVLGVCHLTILSCFEGVGTGRCDTIPESMAAAEKRLEKLSEATVMS